MQRQHLALQVGLLQLQRLLLLGQAQQLLLQPVGDVLLHTAPRSSARGQPLVLLEASTAIVKDKNITIDRGMVQLQPA